MESNYAQPLIKNQVICDTSYVSFDTLRSATSNVEARKDLFEKGKQAAIQFLELQNSI
jgi:hypothetical protein